MTRRCLVVLALLLTTLTAGGTAQDGGEIRYRARIGDRRGLNVTPQPPGATIGLTTIVERGVNTSATSYTTPQAYNCAAGAVCFCFTMGKSATTATTPTLTQTGQTWTAQTLTGVDPVHFNTVAAPDFSVTLFRTLGAGAAPATITADYGATTQNAYALLCYQATGVDTGGTNGSNAVVQAVGARSDSADPFTITLSALGTNGAVLMAAASAVSRTFTAEADYTTGTKIDNGSPEQQAQWHLAASTDATPSWDFSAAAAVGGIAIELKANAAGGDTQAPVCAITAPTSGPIYSTATAAGFVLSGTCTDNVGVANNYSVACVGCAATGTITGDTGLNVSFAVSASTLTCSGGAGTLNTFTITARDAVPNAGTDVLAVTCITPDTIAPTGQITQPTTATTFATATGAQTISGTAADETGLLSPTWECIDQVCTPDSGTATGTATWTFSTTVPCSGGGTATTVRVTFRDTAGTPNTSTDEIVITCTSADVTPPVTTITTNGGANFTATSLPQVIAGTATDAGSGVATVAASCTNAVPSSPLVSGTANWSFNLTGIASGNASVCTVTTTDQAGNMHADTITVTYIADLVIQTTTLPPLTEDLAGQQRCVTATGGVGPFTWSVSAGALPTGMSLSGSTTATECFTGTPTTAQTVTPTFQVVDSQGTPDSDTQQISVTVSAPGSEGPHDYYTGLLALPELYTGIANCANSGCSLRSQAQLDALTPATGTNPVGGYQYIYATDPFPDKQDAAKYVVPAGAVKNGVAQQLRIPTNFGGFNFTDGSEFFITDFYVDRSWMATTCGGVNDGIPAYKFFQHGGGDSGLGDIHFEPQLHFGRARPPNFLCSEGVVAVYGTRLYGSLNNPTPSTGGLTPAGIGESFTQSTIQPTGSNAESTISYPIYANRWTRFISLVEHNVPASSAIFDAWRSDCGIGSALLAKCATLTAGNWDALSTWICDEVRDCVRVLYRVPWPRQDVDGEINMVRSFWYEMDVSSATPNAADTIMYFRNFVVLRNRALNENDTTLFRKPVR